MLTLGFQLIFSPILLYIPVQISGHEPNIMVM